MSSREFAEWMAFAQFHPLGERRADIRMAMLASVITNVMTRTKESDPVHKPDEFMPDFEAAFDELQAQEQVPEHERIWQKIRGRLGGLAKKK